MMGHRSTNLSLRWRHTTQVFGHRKCEKEQNNFNKAFKLFGFFIHPVKERVKQEGIQGFGI